MKTTLSLFAFLVSAACSANAAMCVSGSLQNYINLGAGGCTIGTTLFSNFSDQTGQNFNTPIAPNLVQVSTGGTQFQPSITFATTQTATANTLLESFFRFRVTNNLVGLGLSIDGSATGDGAANTVVDLCPGASFSGNTPSGCPTSPVTLIASTSFSLTDSTTFPSAAFADVFTDLIIDGGSAGTATLNSATLTFTVVPEPSTQLAAVAGIAALVFLRRRQSQASNRRIQ